MVTGRRRRCCCGGVQGCRDKIKTIMHKSKRKVLAALRITNSGKVLDEKSSFAIIREGGY